jgi:hypothetical protein
MLSLCSGVSLLDGGHLLLDDRGDAALFREWGQRKFYNAKQP